MKLETSKGPAIHDPAPDDIRAALNTLDGEAEDFAILAIDDQTYIQAAGSTAAGFVLEYQDGSTDEHYRAKPEPIGAGDVARAMESYLRGSDEWRRSFPWERQDLSSPSGCGTSVMLLLCAAAIALLLVR